MITAVDTNILIDIFKVDPIYFETSKQLLKESQTTGAVIISPPVYSELLTLFIHRVGKKRGKAELKHTLTEIGIELKPFIEEALGIASDSWTRYLQEASILKVQCPKCGYSNKFSCTKCGIAVGWRNHIITDFLIGGHAQALADRLLTRDRGYYKRYFPKLKIVQ